MKLICCNFKMNLLQKDIDSYIKTINTKVKKDNLIFFPSIPYIKDFKNNNYQVGSQNISFKEFGSITGDTSVLQLKELGINYTIIGHSERRSYFNDDLYIDKKIKLAIDNNIKVILCIGENNKTNKEERNNFLKKQIDNALKNNIFLVNNNNLIIAYEPIWSIGSGIIPTEDELIDTINFIKDYLNNTYKLNLKVLYGGSVNNNNFEILNNINIIDGFLIGNYSLKPENIIEISNYIS